MIHSLIQQFEAQANLLDMQDTRDSLDDAVARLAAWLDLAKERLTKDDLTVLVALAACSIARVRFAPTEESNEARMPST